MDRGRRSGRRSAAPGLEGYRAFRARSLADVRLLSLMLDAIYPKPRSPGERDSTTAV